MQGEDLLVTLTNNSTAPVALTWRGIPGLSQAEPLLGQRPIGPDQTVVQRIPLNHAGTIVCDARLLSDGQAFPFPLRAISILEKQSVEVDQDRTLLIEDWLFASNGNVVAPGGQDVDSLPIYTVNGARSFDIATRRNERLRLRFVNACQRSIVAIKVHDHDVRVIAIDSQPAEPFSARDGQLVLAPGTRIDTIIDATAPAATASLVELHDGKSIRTIARLVYDDRAAIRPQPKIALATLPSDELPQKLPLQGARRIELLFDGSSSSSGWIRPTATTTAVAPAFRLKRGQVAVLTLINRSNIPATFFMHGHHFRLLDNLDDGWKPFWLDTLIVDAQQTQRIAFVGKHIGEWLIEMIANDWNSPRLIRSFFVD
jgi:FtsP/CotA-like multicopper oxidase with cupredoxin domain